MSSDSGSSLLRQFRTLFEAGTVAGLTDGQLLERFLAGRDEGGEVAFSALVARHGPMVLGVCRRALADPNDAADAFQATFLVLVRKARSVRVDDSLGRWLYGVSRRVAGRARATASRRPRAGVGEIEAVEARPTDPDRFELASLLDEELARLPESFRSALVLCDLEGLTHEEAARDLRCPVGTIKSRLARGRERLRGRLARRGLSPSSLMVAPVVPASLAEGVVRASLLSVGSGKSAVGMVSTSAVLLAEGVLKSMNGITWKLAVSAVLSLGVVASGASLLAQGRKGEAKPANVDVSKAANSVRDRVDEMENKPDEPTPSNASDRAQRGLTDLLGQLKQARKKVQRAERISRDRQDPAISHARREMSELEDALARINEVLAGIGTAETRRVLAAIPEKDPEPDNLGPTANGGKAPVPDKPEPIVDQGRKVLSGPGKGVEPPREGGKVSLPDYVVEPPDIIIVEVLEALPGRPITGDRLVRPDGKISLGFYGEVYVAGLTTTETKAKIALHLREFINDETLGLARIDEAGKEEAVDPTRTPRIFVDVTAYNSKVYYVQGEVGTPGRFPITGNETVLDAINYAGGVTAYAAKDRIRVVRPVKGEAEGELTLLVNLPAIVNQGQTKTNYQLLPGDRVIVERDPTIVALPKTENAVPREVEARLQTVERKLDEILKALERLPKP